jgi:hypothetical protein
MGERQDIGHVGVCHAVHMFWPVFTAPSNHVTGLDVPVADFDGGHTFDVEELFQLGDLVFREVFECHGFSDRNTRPFAG